MLQFLKKKWTSSWNGKTPDVTLLIMAIVTSVIMVIPFVYIAFRSITGDQDSWRSLLNEALPRLLWNTLSLTFVVTFGAVLIGVTLAWLVNRSDLPGAKWLRWLLALPLVIPPYVGAMTYIIVAGPTSTLGKWLQIDIYSFWGLAFVLTMFTYPYVFLIVSSALKRMNRNFEDVARSQGLNSWQIFRSVNLPFLRPAIGAGAILVSLYVLSDFGAVAILRFTTFTSAIYYQMGNYDTAGASILSLVLIVITVVVLWLESLSRKNVAQQTTAERPPDLRPLGLWKWPASLFVALIGVIAVGLPLVILGYWTSVGLRLGALNRDFWQYTWNSFEVAGLAALLAMLLALPLIYLKSRHPSRLSSLLDRLAYAGYALPGVIVALGLIFIMNRYLPVLYNTVFVIILASLMRFLPQAMEAGGASLNLVSPRIDEASRSLGMAPRRVLYRVILPLIFPGVLAGGALVFVSTLKELPATLLLRPPGFDTLAVRIWIEASDASYHLAAPAALLVVLVSIFPLKWMLDR